MARKKITPEEEVPKIAVDEEAVTADAGDVPQAGPPPDINEASLTGTETPSTKDAGGRDEGNAAETASPAAAEESASAEELPSM